MELDEPAFQSRPVLPAVVGAEEQFAVGEAGADVGLGAAAVASILHGQ